MPFEPGNPWRFQPGSPGGPGRPPKTTEDRILDAFSTALTAEKLESIVKATLERAERGENKALRVLLEYLIGTPVQRSKLSVSDDLVELMRNWRSAAPEGQKGPAEAPDEPA